MTSRIPLGGSGSPSTQPAMRNGIRVTAINLPKTLAPAIKARIITDVRSASRVPSMSMGQVMRRLNSPTNRAPKAPMAPAWVGLYQPKKRPPTTSRKSAMTCHAAAAARSRSPQGAGSAGGASSGRQRESKYTVAANMAVSKSPGTMPAVNSAPMGCWVKNA